MEAIKISDSTSFAKYFNTVRAVLEAFDDDDPMDCFSLCSWRGHG